ncbi:MAG: hypothetical protein JXA42_09215 [Anaerolineales bacterium]|nr:hypothetical protein [Anaerolineales bacterium]
MKRLLFTYAGGMLFSLPALAMFSRVSSSPFTNLDALMRQIGSSIFANLLYLAVILAVPPFGAAIGAKIGGKSTTFQQIFFQAIAGQLLFSIGFSILLSQNTSMQDAIFGMAVFLQTLVFLMISQVGCTLAAAIGR